MAVGREEGTEFEKEETLPGNESDVEEEWVGACALDPDFDYRPFHAVQENEMEDVVHRRLRDPSKCLVSDGHSGRISQRRRHR